MDTCFVAVNVPRCAFIHLGNTFIRSGHPDTCLAYHWCPGRPWQKSTAKDFRTHPVQARSVSVQEVGRGVTPSLPPQPTWKDMRQAATYLDAVQITVRTANGVSDLYAGRSTFWQYAQVRDRYVSGSGISGRTSRVIPVPKFLVLTGTSAAAGPAQPAQRQPHHRRPPGPAGAPEP
jgi:hypothetical protein